MTLQNYSGRLFFANRVSLSCTVSANWRPKGQKTSRRMGVTSPGVGFTTRRVGNTNRRLRKTTRRLVKATSPTMPMVWIFPFLRAHVYAFDFPKKVFTPSHGAYFLLIFIVLGVKACFFKCSHGQQNDCEGLILQAFTEQNR